MNFDEYQVLASQTDQQSGMGAVQDHLDLMMVPLLGLAGEAGELLAEHKKWLRDGRSYPLFPERVTEELGDLLWYLSNVATKHGFRLGEVALANHAQISALGGNVPDANAWSGLDRSLTGIEFNDYQRRFNWVGPLDQPQRSRSRGLLVCGR
jgi:NTP pyrophosphatase (non-canonical NTP hydrolase)